MIRLKEHILDNGYRVEIYHCESNPKSPFGEIVNWFWTLAKAQRKAKESVAA
jgi:hypothetical protein